MRFTVGELLAEALKALGVRRIYGVVGTSVLDFVDVLYGYRGELDFVTVRHEQAAVSMADGEARASGRPGAALVHVGAGFLNAMLGLGIAWRDRSRVMLITGGVARRLKGTGALHEMDQVTAAGTVSEFAARVERPEELPGVVERAAAAMLGPPGGPAVIEVPEGLWTERVDAEGGFLERLSKLPGPPPAAPEREVEEVLRGLAGSERPLIMACGEVARRGVEPVLVELAERFGAYVVTSGNGRGACPEDHPRCLGKVGFGGGSLPADRALASADFLLVLGGELDDVSTYAYTLLPKGEIVTVSLDPLARRRPVRQRLVEADPYSFALRLLERAREAGISVRKRAWDSEVAEAKEEWGRELAEAEGRGCGDGVNPARFFRRLDEALPRDRILVGGGGAHRFYTYDFMRVYRAGGYMASINMGSMAFALPAGVGAKLARPDAEVVVVAGDGELMMAVQELETAVREGVAVKVVVVNDYSYRFLELRQRAEKGGRLHGTLLGNPDFAELARAFGARGLRVTSDAEVDAAVKALVESEGPLVVDLRICRDDVPPSLERSLRALRSGRAPL